MDTQHAQIAASNLPRFRDELQTLLLEYRRLAYLKTAPDCPDQVRDVLAARMKEVEVQIWSTERSIEFLEKEAAHGAEAHGHGADRGDGPA